MLTEYYVVGPINSVDNNSNELETKLLLSSKLHFMMKMRSLFTSVLCSGDHQHSTDGKIPEHRRPGLNLGCAHNKVSTPCK